mmetsp:Transcript_147134/g.254804  ORF Transcript_147134/g.254804 Transcript_147134/m.254804 type:complete len:413 (-) Transcript_147134:30-1268(-)
MLFALLRAARASVCSLFLWLGALVCSFLIFPAVLLLLVPLAAARHCFLRWTSILCATWVRSTLFILRFGYGIKVIMHVRGGIQGLRDLCGNADILLLSNHRTTMDWVFLWGVGSITLRLRGYKAVMMWWMRMIPGFGWAMQCQKNAFLKGRSTERHLNMLRRTVEVQDPYLPTMLLLFPEGRDLTSKNVVNSNKFADQQDPPLPHYAQVLHPRTAGFVNTWKAFVQRSANFRKASPILMDATVGYIDYRHGQRPTEGGVFFRGRSPSEIHVFVEVIDLAETTSDEDLDVLCKELFSKKEKRLVGFYEQSSCNLGQDQAKKSAACAAALLEGEKGVEQVENNYGLLSLAFMAYLVANTSFVACWWLGKYTMWLGVYCAVATLVFSIFGYFCGVDALIQQHEAIFPAKRALAAQ